MPFCGLGVPHRDISPAILRDCANVRIASNERQEFFGDRGSVAIENVYQFVSAWKNLLKQIEVILQPVTIVESDEILVG